MQISPFIGFCTACQLVMMAQDAVLEEKKVECPRCGKVYSKQESEELPKDIVKDTLAEEVNEEVEKIEVAK